MKASLQKDIQKIQQTQHVQKSVGLLLGQLAFKEMGIPLKTMINDKPLCSSPQKEGLKQVNNATISVDLYRFLLFYPFSVGVGKILSCHSENLKELRFGIYGFCCS